MITIRKATIEDYDGVSEVLEEVDALHRDTLPDMFQAPKVWPARSRDEISEMIDNEEKLLVIAEMNGEIVGINIAQIQSTPEIPIWVPKCFAYIGPMAVSETHQRLGIGTKLMEAAFDWTKEKGINKVDLTVFEFNEQAIGFYDKLGFKTFMRRMELKLD